MNYLSRGRRVSRKRKKQLAKLRARYEREAELQAIVDVLAHPDPWTRVSSAAVAYMKAYMRVWPSEES